MESMKQRAEMVKQLAKSGGASHVIMVSLASGEDNMKGSSKEGIYTKHQLATILGYCEVLDPCQIPIVWSKFEESKVLDDCRANIWNDMKAWANNQHPKMVNIETVYLLEPTIKDIINVKPNPGGPIASFDLARKGTFILACHSHSSIEIKKIIRYKEAVRVSHHFRSLSKVLKRNE